MVGGEDHLRGGENENLEGGGASTSLHFGKQLREKTSVGQCTEGKVTTIMEKGTTLMEVLRKKNNWWGVRAKTRTGVSVPALEIGGKRRVSLN